MLRSHCSWFYLMKNVCAGCLFYMPLMRILTPSAWKSICLQSLTVLPRLNNNIALISVLIPTTSACFNFGSLPSFLSSVYLERSCFLSPLRLVSLHVLEMICKIGWWGMARPEVCTSHLSQLGYRHRALRSSLSQLSQLWCHSGPQLCGSRRTVLSCTEHLWQA